MPRFSLRVLSGLQVAALRALARATAEEGARGTAVLVIRAQGIDIDKPPEPLEAKRRTGRVTGACRRFTGHGVAVSWQNVVIAVASKSSKKRLSCHCNQHLLPCLASITRLCTS